MSDMSIPVGPPKDYTALAIIGTILGALSGYVGGKVGDFLEWVYNVFTSIPGILLIFANHAANGCKQGSISKISSQEIK